jgi:hypothetical protein
MWYHWLILAIVVYFVVVGTMTIIKYGLPNTPVLWVLNIGAALIYLYVGRWAYRGITA